MLNNKALAFNISLPVHTVFRSSGLAATLLVGKCLYKQRYPWHQIIACLLVLTGILTVTLADATLPTQTPCCQEAININTSLSNHTVQHPDHTQHNSESSVSLSSLYSSPHLTWCIGILMLSTALFLSAYLGHEQDRTYKLFGKHTWKEVMFYTHLFALPAFILAATDIKKHVELFIQAAPIIIPMPLYHSSLSVSLFTILAVNLCSQAICIRGVYILTTHTNTLTCNLVITFRKLISLLLSVTYFNNPFTSIHWIGTVLVFIGVMVYSNGGSREKEPETQTVKEDTGSKRQSKDAASVSADSIERNMTASPSVVDSVLSPSLATPSLSSSTSSPSLRRLRNGKTIAT